MQAVCIANLQLQLAALQGVKETGAITSARVSVVSAAYCHAQDLINSATAIAVAPGCNYTQRRKILLQGQAKACGTS